MKARIPGAPQGGNMMKKIQEMQENMTRIQQERFASREEYLAQKNTYVLDKKKMLDAKQDMIVLHPLPRVDEIEIDVDDDSRAMYFKQAKYGVYVRMALILTLLELV